MGAHLANHNLNLDLASANLASANLASANSAGANLASPNLASDRPGVTSPQNWSRTSGATQFWPVLLAAVFLVSVPVFIQAPLVRLAPEMSLLLTLGWIGAGQGLIRGYLTRPTAMWLGLRAAVWGDLLLGFSWIWLAGSIYWGWFRAEPLWHLPIEALGVPFAVWGLRQRQGVIGHFFFLGSLLGTAITDLYFYLNQLLPHWRSVMLDLEFDLLHWVFQSAIAQMMTPYGLTTAIGLALALLGLGCIATWIPKPHWWAFSGAVLSTLLVDGIFWLVAASA